MARKAKTRAAALAATAGFAGAQAAHAHDEAPAAQQSTAARWDGTGWLPAYTNQRTSNDPVLAAIHAYAQRFFDQRGVRAAAPTQLDVADSLADAGSDGTNTLARGASPTSGYKDYRIILNGQLTGERLAQLRSKNRSRQKIALKDLYTTLAHEEGHVRGQGHSDAGLMSHDKAETPGDWRRLMRQLQNEGLIAKGEKPKRRRGTSAGSVEA